MQSPTSLVLNWHLTEACNYRCQYCYAAWTDSKCARELIHHSQLAMDLLDELYSFFRPDNLTNPLASQLNWSSVRLNLAGGEPLLNAGKLNSIVQHARSLGFEVSLITNGSRLSHEMLMQLAPNLSWLASA